MKFPQEHCKRLMGAIALCIGPHLGLARTTSFVETDLVSDLPGRAAFQDLNLVNPWGLAFSPTSPFWVGNNGSGVSTLYNGAGNAQALVVTLPPPAGGTPPSKPTGVVFNGGSGFGLVANGAPARFLFAAEDGTLSGWNPTANPTQAILKVDNSSTGAIYKGLAIGNTGSGDFLYAANFHAGTIDVFDSLFAPANLPGSFFDPALPSGYAPFNIQKLGSVLYVTYAQQDASQEDDEAGAGNGFVDRFDLNGNFLNRLISRGPLNSPWGLALAPSAFGTLAGDLLVGNFGDGLIHAFDPVTGTFEGTLADPQGHSIQIPGLWALIPGNGGSGGDPDDLYFTAGIENELHGLFGEIAAIVPEAGTGAPVALGSVILVAFTYSRRRKAN